MLFKGDKKLTDKERIVLLTMAWLMVHGRNPKKHMILVYNLSIYSHFDSDEVDALLKTLTRKKFIQHASPGCVEFRGAAKCLMLKVTTTYEVTHHFEE